MKKTTQFQQKEFLHLIYTGVIPKTVTTGYFILTTSELGLSYMRALFI